MRRVVILLPAFFAVTALAGGIPASSGGITPGQDATLGAVAAGSVAVTTGGAITTDGGVAAASVAVTSGGAITTDGGTVAATSTTTDATANKVIQTRPITTYSCADGTAIGAAAGFGCWKYDSSAALFVFNQGIKLVNTTQFLGTSLLTPASASNGSGLTIYDLNGDGSGAQTGVALGTNNFALSNAASALIRVDNNGVKQWAVGITGLQTLYGAAPRRVGCYQTATNADTDLATVGTQVIGIPAGTAVNGGGTCTPGADTTDNSYEMVKFPTDGGGSGHACGKSGPFTILKPTHAPLLYGVLRTDASSIANTRTWFGTVSASLDQVATLAGGNGIKYCAFRYDSGLSDTNWMACSSDGTTASCTSTAIAVATATTYVLLIDNSVSGTCDFYVNGVRKVNKTTNIDATNTARGIEASITELASNAVGISISKIILTQN